jgi:hypothetical protein
MRSSISVLTKLLVNYDGHEDKEDEEDEENIDCRKTTENHGYLEVDHWDHEEVSAVLRDVHIVVESPEGPGSEGGVVKDLDTVVRILEVKGVSLSVLDEEESSDENGRNKTEVDHAMNRIIGIEVAEAVSVNPYFFFWSSGVHQDFVLIAWLGDEATNSDVGWEPDQK